jgi:hypothetical protein
MNAAGQILHRRVWIDQHKSSFRRGRFGMACRVNKGWKRCRR